MLNFTLLWLFTILSFSTLFQLSDGGLVNCFQCNVFNQGAREFCDNAERKMYNCTGCLKTYTRVYMHDQWLSYKYISVTSKYCIQFMNFVKDEGCYTMSADQGYVRRCYCYSHWCNSGSIKYSIRTKLLVGIQAVITILLFQHVTN